MSSNSSLITMQQYFTRYGMTTYFVFGTIGLLINIAIFTRPAHVRNPGSLYILSMSLCAFIGLYISVIPVIYMSYCPDLRSYPPLFCQLQLYFRHAFNQMMRTFFILACADRYAISSNNLRVRSFSRIKVTFRVIPSVIVFWHLLAIFPTMLLHSVGDGRCIRSPAENIIFSVYLLISVGFIPLTSMVAFSTLLYINLKRIRRRIQPIANVNQPINQPLRKRDRDMIKMLLIEMIGYIITTMPTTLVLTYTSVTVELVKSQDRLNIESFVGYLTETFLLYLNNGLSFWIYICISRSFRLELKNLIIKFYGFITAKQVRLHEIN